MVVHRPHRQQGGDIGDGGADAAVGKHQDLATAPHGLLGLGAEEVEGSFQPPRASDDGHQGGDGAGGNALVGQGIQLGLMENRAI